MLYACDGAWWRLNNGVKHFAGIKVTQDRNVLQKFRDVKLIRTRKGFNNLLFQTYGEVGWAGNGGFHAFNLAIQFGATKIILIGFDMSLDHGYHWHGRHQPGLNNPKPNGIENWRICFDAQKPLLDRMGIQVVIGSPNSRLAAYPKLSFMEAVLGANAHRMANA